MNAEDAPASGNLYAVLGVDIKASQDAIRSRYLQLARLWHPDRYQGRKHEEEAAKRKFQEIVSAFEVLSDEQRRASYDLSLLDLLDVEDYLQRFQGLILTVCGLGMTSGAMSMDDAPVTPASAAHSMQTLQVTKRWLLTA